MNNSFLQGYWKECVLATMTKAFPTMLRHPTINAAGSKLSRPMTLTDRGEEMLQGLGPVDRKPIAILIRGFEKIVLTGRKLLLCLELLWVGFCPGVQR